MLTIRTFAANREAERGLTFAVETALRSAGFRWISCPNGNAGWDQPVGLGLSVYEWLQKWGADNGVSVDYFPGNIYCPAEAYVGRRDLRRQVAAEIMAQQPHGQPDYRLVAVKVIQRLLGKATATPAQVESVLADIEPRATADGPLKGRRLSEVMAVAQDEALIRTQTRGAATYATLRQEGGYASRILGLKRVEAEPGGYYVTAGLCHSMSRWGAWVDAALESLGVKS